jgi:uncharacterized membrane protein YjdF
MKDIFNILIFPFFIYLLGFALEVGVPIYQVITWPNRFVHFLGGVSAAVAAYFILDLLKRNKLITVSSKWLDFALIIMAVMSIAGFWEFHEYFSDTYFFTHAQPSVEDTMKDMIMGTLGACTYCLGWYVKGRFKKLKAKK